MRKNAICYRCGHNNCRAGKPPYNSNSCQFVAPCRIQGCAQGSPKKRPEKIRLEDTTYKIVRRHINTLASIQSSLISLTEEIKRLDTLLEKESVPQHLLVRRSRPKLPSNLNHSEELKSS
ncbi:hypothetical protein HOLleu_19482 [Holothuria leucospilota]|uniref:Uncharacterized protein n=1 Tax=Holothuria leucospilota TaxID=206669 RepID=A0A9Q1C045_HOLLE|nr:hypothetical protein HOLleu_19482 [Holothuria leucospilota]